MRAASAVARLAPLIAMLFVAYLVIGLSLPALPLHVHDRLGFGAKMVGVASGSQFAAALLSRVLAGRYTDRRGPKRAVVTGLTMMTGSGVVFLASVEFMAQPVVSIVVLLAGRALLGIGESFLITGTLAWGLALLGAGSTGKAMSWLGTALYAAFAVGAPVGTSLYGAFGFTGIAAATALTPLIALAVAVNYPAVAASQPAPAAIGKVLRAVWRPGTTLALSGVGFSAVTTFITLLFALRGWSTAWSALTLVSVAFIVGRALFGHLPDRIGGPKVALVCLGVEAVGQVLIWTASSSLLAFAGIGLTGLGYSLVYPGLGVEAIRAAPPQNRAMALGAYTAFLDVSLGFSAPLLGWIATGRDLGVVYLASALAVVASAGLAAHMTMRPGAAGRGERTGPR